MHHHALRTFPWCHLCGPSCFATEASASSCFSFFFFSAPGTNRRGRRPRKAKEKENNSGYMTKPRSRENKHARYYPVLVPGPRGPPGLTGQQGPTGPLASAFLSYYSNQSQSIGPDTSVLLAFTTLQTSNGTITSSSSTVAPPAVDTFTATLSGVYLIAWNVAITISISATSEATTATLDLLVNGTPVNPPFESQGYGAGTGTLTYPAAGSFSVNVTAGQSIQLRVTNQNPLSPGLLVVAASPSISVLRVADIP